MAQTILLFSLFPNGIKAGQFQQEVNSDSITQYTVLSVSKSGLNVILDYAEDATTDVPRLELLAASHVPLSNSATETISLSNKSTADGRLRVAIEKSSIDSITYYSHNWCDKTTWYTMSTKVTNEVPVNSGDDLTFNLTNTDIIDLYHGKVQDEDDLVDSNDDSYLAIVTLDTVAQVEEDPHHRHITSAAHGDYVIDYEAGTVTFHSAVNPASIVRVSYYYATTSEFKIVPPTNNTIQIESVELQFSQNITIRDTTQFITYGSVDDFAPELLDNPYPSGTIIPLRTKLYKTLYNYIGGSMRSYPAIPPLSISTWRGMQDPVSIFDWDYQRGLVLDSSKGMSITIKLEHNEEFGGSHASVTFYCSREEEDT